MTETQLVADAIALFLADAASAKGRGLAKPTLGKYQTLLRRLRAFCEQCRIEKLSELTPEALRRFRDTWPTGPAASGNNITRLKAFFKFAVENEWLQRNPAIALKAPKHQKRDDHQKLPFTEEEMVAILAAANTVQLRAGSNADLVTLIYLMRHTGLRISDAVLLKTDRISEGQLRLYTQKTGSWVEMPMQRWLLAQLQAIEPKDGFLFVAAGASKRLETVTDLWRRKLAKVFEAAGVIGTPHRFRHTFAVDLLSKGVDIKSVSLLLGHSSVTITEKFYAAWISSRQQALSEELRGTWVKEPAA